MNMRVLAFDTSTSYLTACCLDGGDVLSSYHEYAGIRHSEILVPVLSGIMEEAGWTPGDLDLICTGLGPGSFTGLRIAISTTKGIAAVTGCPVKGVPTYDAIAEMVPFDEGLFAPLFDARKGKVYSCMYARESGRVVRKGEMVLEEMDDLLRGLTENVAFFGDATEKYSSALSKCHLASVVRTEELYPRAEIIGRLGMERSAASTDDPRTLEPLYMHSKDANITKRV